jgi:hypothetical protein
MPCGELLWSGASGVMDVDSQRPAGPRTLFATASAGKPITAALVLDLVERRKLSLSTRLSRFYPRLPKARRITVRMLLNHTSGLNEYFDDPRIVKTFNDEPTHRWKRSEVLRAVNRSQFAPGTRYRYTNSNYVVLGGIIDKVGRKPVERIRRPHLARPRRRLQRLRRRGVERPQPPRHRRRPLEQQRIVDPDLATARHGLRPRRARQPAMPGGAHRGRQVAELLPWSRGDDSPEGAAQQRRRGSPARRSG